VSSRSERVTEARRVEALPGGRTFDEVRRILQDAVSDRFGSDDAMDGPWVRDLTDEWVAYETYDDTGWCTHQVTYTMADDGAVSFTGDPVEVEVRTSYSPGPAESDTGVTEAVHVDGGRVLESKGADTNGGRVFSVQIVEAGTSKNGYRYPADVLEAAAPLYEGAKAFDHHRSLAELQSSTVAGLVGYYRNIEADRFGIKGDLHLLPSAAHIGEALDASIEAQAAGLPPVVGISHDVTMVHKPAIDGGRRINEATRIDRVLSADVVADPSAGGRATRVVAGGSGSDTPPNTSPKETITMNLQQLLTLLRQAKAEDRAALLQEHAAVVEASGFTADQVTALIDVTESPEAPGGPAADTSADVADADKEPVLVAESLQTRMIVREAITAAGLPADLAGEVIDQLGDRFTESQVVRTVSTVKRVLEGAERKGLTPTVGHVEVTADAQDKKRERLLRTFEGNFTEGYHSLHQAYADISGMRERDMLAAPDLGAQIIRESYIGAPVVGRATESLASGSWGEILADTLNRRVVAEYNRPNLQSWRALVNTVPVSDFRSQKLVRMGGYGTLPTVPEGSPYQPLTSPADEQATYSPTKKGGTEDFTYEAARNDDLRQLLNIPRALARAAAKTVYLGVFNIFSGNPTIYDSTTLFVAGHNNTTAVALGQAGLSTARRLMRDQAAYGDAVDILGLTPKYLIVPNELEELAFQLCSSAVAIPATPAGPTDTPNLHQGLTPIVVDDFTDANDWFIAADPMDCPGIEVGFLDGKVDPELFLQDDPSNGSHFNADKITYKIRHIWGIGVVDFRAFVRGTQ
jgi:hypothetical protein